MTTEQAYKRPDGYGACIRVCDYSGRDFKGLTGNYYLARLWEKWLKSEGIWKDNLRCGARDAWQEAQADLDKFAKEFNLQKHSLQSDRKRYEHKTTQKFLSQTGELCKQQ